jgi:hypothetical protein
MKKIVLAVTLFLSSSVAWASEWHGMGMNSDAIYFYDAATLRRDQSTIIVWVSMYKNSKTTKNAFSMLKIKEEVNCASRELRSLQILSYDVDGELLRSFDAPQKLKEPAPDTLGDSLVNDFCKAGFDPRDPQTISPDPASKAKEYFDWVKRQPQEKH